MRRHRYFGVVACLPTCYGGSAERGGIAAAVFFFVKCARL